MSIVGPSGCGKSTCLRVLSGLLPSGGQHQCEGAVVIDAQTPQRYRASGKLSFMFQEPTLMPNLTVTENIAEPLHVRGIFDYGPVKELIASVGLERFARSYPQQLSGGMKTRVALARSFVTRPDLLLLDEPFSSLDIAWKSVLYRELESLRRQFGTTIIFVTHDVQEALLLSDQILVLNGGGAVESRHSLPAPPVPERLLDIAGFLRNVYEDYLLPIQTAIIEGKNKYHEDFQTVN